MTEYTAYMFGDDWSIESFPDGNHTILADGLTEEGVRVWAWKNLKPGDDFTWEPMEE